MTNFEFYLLLICLFIIIISFIYSYYYNTKITKISQDDITKKSISTLINSTISTTLSPILGYTIGYSNSPTYSLLISNYLTPIIEKSISPIIMNTN
jgi:ABC-type Fe3+ transport system permease subunit